MNITSHTCFYPSNLTFTLSINALGMVSINYSLSDKTDTAVREGDILSLRGAGKGRVTGFGGNSRKGRLYVYTEIYQ